MEQSDIVNDNFAVGGDYAISFAPELEQVINAGVSFRDDSISFSLTHSHSGPYGYLRW